MGVAVLGLGTALPAHRVSQARSAEMAVALCSRDAQQTRAITRLYERSRIQSRYSVLLQGRNGNGAAPTQTFFAPATGADDRGPTTRPRMQQYADLAAPLAERAARAALDEANVGADEIGHLITVSCTGFAAPGVDIDLIRALELPADVARTHVGFMGCHGAFNGLRVARALARDVPAQRPHVLVCAVELCSLHFAYGASPQQIVANALFADGAAAMVGREAGNESQSNPRNRDGVNWRLAANGSVILPDSADAMTWRICDHGFEMTLSPRVPGLIKAHLRPWLGSWLAGHGLDIGSIGSWAVHPGGPRVLESVAEALDLPAAVMRDSRRVLEECGNMSSPTILFILDRLRRSDAPRPCVALGFGPGLTAEAMLFV